MEDFLKTKIETHVQSQRDAAFESLRRLVDINSFSGNAPGLKQAADCIADIAAGLGFNFTPVPIAGGPAQHLFYDGRANEHDPFYAVIGHFDTVHPPDSPFSRLQRKGDNLHGPGVQDMKSGLVAALYAMAAVKQVTGAAALPLKVVFNCDEEIGSVDSRALIEREMAGAAYAFIFEGHQIDTQALVSARKGILLGDMTVHGRAAHAGEAPEKGASAIVEAAHKIAALDGLTDFNAGTIVTTGQISGGTVANRIADHCRSTIDVRFVRPEDEQAVRTKIQHILKTTHVAGCTTEYQLTQVRPSFIKTAAADALLKKYVAAAEAFGVTLTDRMTGGGSDGNFTANMGIPTIDGIGAAGDFAHTNGEYILAESFIDSINIFALLLANLMEAS